MNKEKGSKTKCPTCVIKPKEKPSKNPRSLQNRNTKRAPIGKYLEKHFVKLMDNKYRKHL